MNTAQHVAVDVLSWIQAIEAAEGAIVMNGHFRHLKALCSLYHPAVLLEDALARRLVETPALKALSSFLAMPIREYRLDGPPAVWISSAIDSHCPALGAWKGKCLRLAVLHDCAPVCTTLFSAKKELFVRGTELHEAVLPVSRRCWQQFREAFPTSPMARINYGGFHEFEELASASRFSSSRQGVLTVANFYRYKDLPATIHYGQSLDAKITLAGRRTADYSEADYRDWSRKAVVVSPSSDAELRRLYQKAAIYAAFSQEESLPLTPMEAILHAVPRVVVSDIPGHREAYDGLGVNFRPLPLRLPVGELAPVTDKHRQATFERYRFTKVTEPLRSFVASVI